MVDENQELNAPEMGDNVPELSEGESQDVNPNINNNMEKETNGNESSPNSEDSSQPEVTNRGALEYRLRQQSRKLDRRLEQFEAKIADAITKGLSQPSAQASNMQSNEGNTNMNSQSSVAQVNPNEVQKLVNQALSEKEAIATQNTFNQYEEAAKRKFEDYNEVIEDLVHTQAITPLMVETIKDLPDAPELIYSIAKSNPQEFERISKLSPVQQMREMAFVIAKHQPSDVLHGTEEEQNEQQPQVKPNPHKPLPPVSNRGGSMSHSTTNYGFDDRLSELAAGYRKSRP